MKLRRAIEVYISEIDMIAIFQQMAGHWEMIGVKKPLKNNEKDKSNERSSMNKWEKACREWLKGCSCAQDGKQEECQECTQAFLEKIREIKTEE